MRSCGRHLAAVVADGEATPRHAVEVRRREVDGAQVAGFGGLYACGSVWACPRCASVIAYQRSAEIARAVAWCQAQGGSVHMLTLTLRHTRADALVDMFDVLTAGWRGVVGGRAWTGAAGRDVGDRARFSIAGVVRVVEATVSRPDDRAGSGWHLHIHALLFCSEADLGGAIRADWHEVLGDLPTTRAALGRYALGARVFERWSRAVRAAGGREVGAAGVDLRTIADGGAEFVGRYLEKSTYDAARVGAEIAAGDSTKRAGAGRLAPFELLHDLLTDPDAPRFGVRTPRAWEVVETAAGVEIVDVATGEVTPVVSPGGWGLWHEWELATRGRRRVRWSNRPRRVRGPLDEFWIGVLGARADAGTDEDVARRTLDGEVLGEIARESWSGVLAWRPSWLVEILEIAERDGRAALRAWMDAHDIEWREREAVDLEAA